MRSPARFRLVRPRPHLRRKRRRGPRRNRRRRRGPETRPLWWPPHRERLRAQAHRRFPASRRKPRRADFARSRRASKRTPIRRPASCGRLIEAGREEPEFLHPDVAFRLEASAQNPGLAVVRWRIEPGYYLYAKRTEVHLPEGSPPGTSIAGLELPRGEMQEDPYFGRVEVYRFDAAASVRLAHAVSPPPDLTLDVVYQGCADEGLCYPPIQKSLSVRLDGGAPGATVVATTGASAGTSASPASPAGSPPSDVLALRNGPHRLGTRDGRAWRERGRLLRNRAVAQPHAVHLSDDPRSSRPSSSPGGAEGPDGEEGEEGAPPAAGRGVLPSRPPTFRGAHSHGR